MALLEDRICPVCRQQLKGMICSRCGLDLTAFNCLTATARQLLTIAGEYKEIVEHRQVAQESAGRGPDKSRPFSAAGLADRLDLVRAVMSQKALDACLVFSPENIYYLTGLDHIGGVGVG